MDIIIANKSILALFFLYLVMFGSILISLLNCELQRFILHNNIIKHFIIFLSIFIFTFILDWYSPSSLVLNNNEKNNNDKNNNNGKNKINEEYENKNKNKQYNYIFESIKYTFLIYILFILSSKQEKIFMYIFIILLLIIIILYIIYLININYYKINQDYLKQFFIYKNKFTEFLSSEYNLNPSLINKLFIMHNILSVLYIVLITCLLIGFYLYALKQKKEKKNNFNWIIFIFGISKCRNT